MIAQSDVKHSLCFSYVLFINTLKEETFAEETFAISRIFGKIVKVRSREKSQKQSFAKVCSREKCEKESFAKVNSFKKNLNFSFRIIHKALSFNKKNNTRLNGAVKLVSNERRGKKK